MEAEKEKKLREEVADHYEVVGGVWKAHWFNSDSKHHENVNLENISLERAESLVKAGFPYLKKKK